MFAGLALRRATTLSGRMARWGLLIVAVYGLVALLTSGQAPAVGGFKIDPVSLGRRDLGLLTAGEIAVRDSYGPGGRDLFRAMAYWAKQAGCEHLLDYKKK